MGQDQDRIKAMEFDHPEYIPVSAYFLPATWIKYREDLAELAAKYPIAFGEQSKGVRDYDGVSGNYAEGEHVDLWGCVRVNIHNGLDSMVKYHPVPTREAIRTLKAPEQVPDGMPHGFMYLRLADLRGFEEVMLDFAEEPPELQMLIDAVLEHNLRTLDKVLDRHQGKIITLGDDLGMQTSLPISPIKWRKYLKPCYAKIFGRCHEAGLSVYLHTDGHIIEIIPDLIECGVNVLNPQIRANGLDNLVRACKGKVCLDLDLDRQMFPFCKPQDIDTHVREVVEKLGSPEGGLWIKAECGPDVPLANIEAIAQALEKYRSYFSKGP